MVFVIFVFEICALLRLFLTLLYFQDAPLLLTDYTHKLAAPQCLHF